MHPVILNKTEKSPLTSSQITFNRQRRKIDQLYEQIKMRQNEYEQALTLYHSEVRPSQKTLADLITEFLLKVMDLTQAPKALNKKERQTLHRVVEDDLNLLFFLLPLSDISEEMKTLYKHVFKKNNNDILPEELSDLKEMLKNDFDVEIPDLGPDDKLEDIFIRVKETLDARKEKERGLPPPKSKSKKELLKEKHTRDLEALQNRGIGNLYKRLVKEFHPDLEQDAEKKSEKELVMKRVTEAYERRDLVSLLNLESECFSESAEPFSEQTIKIYNGLLKNQIKELQDELALTYLNPRYIEIRKYVQKDPNKPLEVMRDFFNECPSMIDQYSGRLSDLSQPLPLKALKQALGVIQKNFDYEEEEQKFLDFLERAFY